MEYTPLEEKVSERLVINLFQSIPELLRKIAPEGFEYSELVKVFHPSPERQYQEYRFARLRLIQLRRTIKKPIDVEPMKPFYAFLKEIKPEPIREQYEIVSIFGDCLWDIFSNNHTVFNQQNESYDLGLWRGSGYFIADVINKLHLVPDQIFDYMDFYMGSFTAKDRANLTEVYACIFKKLKDKNLDWEYSFPHIGLVNFRSHEDERDNPETYNPGQSMIEELENKKKDEEIDKLQEEFDRIFMEEYEKARYEKPSQEVMAYFKIYRHWPKGRSLSN